MKVVLKEVESLRLQQQKYLGSIVPSFESRLHPSFVYSFLPLIGLFLQKY